MLQTSSSETDQESFEEYKVSPKKLSRKKVWYFITKASRKLNPSSKSIFCFEKGQNLLKNSSTLLDAKKSPLRDYYCQYLTTENQSPYCVAPAYHNLVQPIPSFGKYINMSRPRSPNQNQMCSSTCKNQWYNRTPAPFPPRWYRTCIPSIVPRNHLMPPISRRCVECPWRDDEDEQEICSLCRALIIDQTHTCCKCSKHKKLSDSDSDEEDDQDAQDNEQKNKKSKSIKYEHISCECNLDVRNQKVNRASFGTQTLPYPKERQQIDFHDYLENYPFNNAEFPDGRLNTNGDKPTSRQNVKVTQDDGAVPCGSLEMINRMKWKLASLHPPPFLGGHSTETDVPYSPWKKKPTENNMGPNLLDYEGMSTTLLGIQKSLNRIEKRQIDEISIESNTEDRSENEPVPGNYFEQTPIDSDGGCIDGIVNKQKASRTDMTLDDYNRSSFHKVSSNSNTFKQRRKLKIKQGVGFNAGSSQKITKSDTSATNNSVNTQQSAPGSSSFTRIRRLSSKELDKFASTGVSCDQDDYTTKTMVTLDDCGINVFKINATTQTSVELYSDAVCRFCRKRFEIDIHFRNTDETSKDETSKDEDVRTDKRKRAANSKSKNKGKINAKRNGN